MNSTQLFNVTSKEIAYYTVADIEIKYRPSMGYGSWENIARENINNAFHMARKNRRMVTAVANEIIELSYSRGNQFGDGMSMAVGRVLTDWLILGLLRSYEIKRTRKMFES